MVHVQQIIERLVLIVHHHLSRKLAQDPVALGVLFRNLRDVERDGESLLVELALPQVPSNLAPMVRAHADDERRHEALMSEVLQTLNQDADAARSRPASVSTLNQEAGGMLQDGTHQELGRAYLLLYAQERRLSSQLTQLASDLEAHLPEIAAVVRTIAGDERKHIGWCSKISYHLIEDPQLWAREREAVVALEARTYPRRMAQHLNAILDEDLHMMSSVERSFWRGIACAASELPPQPVSDRDGTIGRCDWSPHLPGATWMSAVTTLSAAMTPPLPMPIPGEDAGSAGISGV